MSFLGALGRTFGRMIPATAQRGVSMDSGTAELLDYFAAQQGRTTDWIFAPIRSSSQDVGRSLKRFRANARELARDNAYATHYQGLVGDNVIGPEGMSYRATVREAGELVRPVNKALEDGWLRWSEDRKLATADHSGGWPDVERLLVENMVTDGEGLLRHYPGFENRVGYAVQVLDPDQLDDTLLEPVGNGRPGTDGREIRFGVELDVFGAPVAYWLWTNHPAEGREKRVRVPADQISLLYFRHRANQPRGLSWFAPILAAAKMLAGYQEAELVAARTAAAKMGFFERDPEAVTDPGGDRGRSPKIRMSAKPGTIETLPLGWKFNGWDPTHPTTAYPAFVKGNLRSQAAGLRVGYNTLAQDLEGVNFSSLRQGNLQERDVWRGLQALARRIVHYDVHGHWLRSSLLSSSIDVPSRRAEDYMARRFIPRGWEWVDPKKGIEADALAVKESLDTRTSIVARRTGRQFEDIVEELREEKALLEDAGLLTSSSSGDTDDGTDEAASPDADELEELVQDAEDAGERARRARSNGSSGDLAGDDPAPDFDARAGAPRGRTGRW